MNFQVNQIGLLQLVQKDSGHTMVKMMAVHGDFNETQGNSHTVHSSIENG